jgi:two-component system, OmpR family, phosphate regulon response regulator PhoB
MDTPSPDSAPHGKRILVVDPDRGSREVARRSLEMPDLEISEASGVAEAIEIADRIPPDVVISDLVLADGSGFALCQRFRENAQLASKPIVIVSRWSLEADRILAFECGADDFVAKPYFARELVSRVRAVLRRSAHLSLVSEERQVTARDGLVVDSSRRAAWVDGAMVPLTPREFSLLETLVRSGGRVLTRTDLILQAFSSPDGLHERSVDAHIKSLRRKLGSARDAVETVRGLGYRFADEGRSHLLEGPSDPVVRLNGSHR